MLENILSDHLRLPMVLDTKHSLVLVFSVKAYIVCMMNVR